MLTQNGQAYRCVRKYTLLNYILKKLGSELPDLAFFTNINKWSNIFFKILR